MTQLLKEATVREKPSVKSKRTTRDGSKKLPAHTLVHVFEEAESDGHRRARIGENEWISLKTAAGDEIAIPPSQDLMKQIGDKTEGMMGNGAHDCIVSFPGGALWKELLDQLRHEQHQDALARSELAKTWNDIKAMLSANLGFLKDAVDGLLVDVTGEILESFPELKAELDAAIGQGPLAGDGIVSLACVFTDVAAHPEDVQIHEVIKGLKETGQLDIPSNKDSVEIAGHCLPVDARVKTANKSFNCFCARLGSLNNDISNGYQDSEGFPKQGDDGCAWFKTWLDNVEKGHAACAQLHVVQKSDQPQEYWTLGQPLGHAQTLEVLTLEQLGYDFKVHESPGAFLKWFQAQPKAHDRIAEFLPKVEDSVDLRVYAYLMDAHPGRIVYCKLAIAYIVLLTMVVVGLLFEVPQLMVTMLPLIIVCSITPCVHRAHKDTLRNVDLGLAELQTRRAVAGKVPLKKDDLKQDGIRSKRQNATSAIQRFQKIVICLMGSQILCGAVLMTVIWATHTSTRYNYVGSRNSRSGSGSW